MPGLGNTKHFPYEPGLCDFNGDGFAELYMGGFVVDLQNQTSYGGSIINVFLYRSVAADVLPDDFCDNCAGPELVNGNHVYSVNIDVNNPANSKVQIEMSLHPNDYPNGWTSVADINEDGHLDVVVTATRIEDDDIYTGPQMIYVWDVFNDVVLFKEEFYKNDKRVGSVSIGDFTGNGSLEMLFVWFNEIRVYRWNPVTKQVEYWTFLPSSDSSGYTSGMGYDFDGDGALEYVHRDESHIRIFTFTENDWTLVTQAQCRSATGSEYPIIGDLNKDGLVEIYVPCTDYDFFGSEYSARITSFQVKSSGPMTIPRNMFHQSSFNDVFIHDDMSIPKNLQNHGLVDCLNNFQCQSHILTEDCEPWWPTVELALDLGEDTVLLCGEASVSYDITHPEATYYLWEDGSTEATYSPQSPGLA